jgi:hypothetical protein
MKGILGLLAKARLVDLTPEEQATLETAPQEQPEPSPPVADIVLPPPAPAESAIEEGKSLEDIFALAGIPPAAFPAEKLLRLLDGLRAMDASTRKAAVLAMDAADDTWTIADPVTDAQRKMAALEAYKQRLSEQVASAERGTAAEVGEIKSALERNSAEIRAQIAELERLLEREIAKAAQQTTGLEASLSAAKEAAAREQRRMDREIGRLSEIPASFALPATEH